MREEGRSVEEWLFFRVLRLGTRKFLNQQVTTEPGAILCYHKL